MILRIQMVEVVGPHRLKLAFNDGSHGEIDPRVLMSGPVFEPLYDPVYFAKAELDPLCGTVVWPNGADFAPEALRKLVPSLSKVA